MGDKPIRSGGDLLKPNPLPGSGLRWDSNLGPFLGERHRRKPLVIGSTYRLVCSDLLQEFPPLRTTELTQHPAAESGILLKTIRAYWLKCWVVNQWFFSEPTQLKKRCSPQTFLSYTSTMHSFNTCLIYKTVLWKDPMKKGLMKPHLDLSWFSNGK